SATGEPSTSTPKTASTAISLRDAILCHAIACALETADGSLLRGSGPIENLVWGRRDHFDVFRYERPTLNIFYELRLDFVGEHFSDARVLFDVGPLRDQEEPLGILGVATQDAVLHLRPRLVHRVAV